MPPDYENSVYRWSKMGVPIRLVERSIKIAMSKTGLRGDFPEFTYMAGIVWRTLEEVDVPLDLTEAKVHLYTAMELEDELTNQRIDAYMQGRASVGA